MVSKKPPATPLPANVLNLMHLTVELVDLLYWRPVATKGSQGEAVYIEMMKCQHRQGNLGLPVDMDHETRKANGRVLMSGHGTLPFLSTSQIQSTE